MSETTYFGNCANLINWNDVIANLESRELGMFIDCSEHTFRKRSLKRPSEESEHQLRNLQIWVDNRYDLSAADFTAFRPDIHFDKSVAEKFCEWVGVGFENVWITRIDPGCTVPPHYDIYPHEDNSKQYERYMAFISPPAVGQLWTIGDNGYHAVKQGETYHWSKPTEYHSGANCSFKPVFAIHAEGPKL